jgi:hypothetical protein
MLARLAEIVQNPTTPPRPFHAAVKAIGMLSRINLSAVDVAIRAHQHEELTVRLDELEKRVGMGTGGSHRCA